MNRAEKNAPFSLVNTRHLGTVASFAFSVSSFQGFLFDLDF